MQISNEGQLSVICGASRNGKSALTLQAIQEFSRALVWDVDDEYQENGLKPVRGIKNLTNELIKTGGKPFKIAYIPGGLGEFDRFCQVVLSLADDLKQAGNPGLAVVVEETADVTSPSKAPANYRILIGRGMKRGISLFCVTQRPSESDKTSLGNAKYLVSFYMTRAADREYMAREIGCTAEDIEALEKLEFLKKDVDGRKITKGKLEF